MTLFSIRLFFDTMQDYLYTEFYIINFKKLKNEKFRLSDIKCCRIERNRN